jgi:hypothetical protein
MKWLLLLLFLVVPAVLAANLDTNITIRAACVDVYGNLCANQGYWTVINPTGTTIYNQTQGDSYHYGISNFTIWLNKTGVYHILVNFSDVNLSAEYNVLVMDYKTEEISSLYGDASMIPVILILVGIMVVIAYLSMKMSQDHAIIKWFLAFIVFLFIIASLAIASHLTNNAVVKTIIDSLFYVSIVITSVVFLYAMIYLVWVVYTKNKFLPEKKEPKYNLKNY